MKGCIIIMACHPWHLEVFDPIMLSKISDYTKILIVDENLSNCLSDTDHQCYDDIYQVTMKKGSRYDFDELINLITPLTKEFSPRNISVFTTDEFNVEIITKVIKELGLTGYNPDKVNLFRDKDLMKSYLSENSNVKLPKHTLLDSNTNYESLDKALGSPFVIKPLAGAGARDISFINNNNDFVSLKNKLQNNFSGFEAETYLSGQLFHVDSVRINGQLKGICISEYLHPIADFIKGQPSGSIAINQEHFAYEEIYQLNADVLNTFNEDGCFHLECFYEKEQGATFLEIGWRQSGAPAKINFSQLYGGYSQTVFQIFESLNYPTPKSTFSDLSYFKFFLPKRVGIFKGIIMPSLQSEIDIVFELEIGEEITDTPSIFFDIAAKVWVKNSDYDALYQDFLKVRKAISLYQEA